METPTALKPSSRPSQLRRDLASDALSQHLIGLAVIILAGIASVVLLPTLWPEPGDTPNSSLTIAAQGATFVFVASLAATCLARPTWARRHATPIAATLASVALVSLLPLMVQYPGQSWTVAIMCIIAVVSGAVFPTFSWVGIILGTAWGIFTTSNALYLTIAAAPPGVAIPGRTPTILLAAATACSLYIHRYVHTYTASFETIVDRAAAAAFTDHLTGLPNRAGAYAAYAALQASDYHVDVMIADMDGLKAINDTLGHPAGDTAIVAVASALRDSLPAQSGVCARWGGDEFVIISPAGKLGEAAFKDKVARRLSAHPEGALGVSMGAPFRARPGTTLDQAVAASDHFLYQEKASRT